MDQGGLFAERIFMINVQDRIDANAGPDQTIIDSDSDGYGVIFLNGTASTAPVGRTLTQYLWTREGSLVGMEPIVVTALPVGVHMITLRVTADDGEQATDEVVITVQAAPLRPGDADGDGDVDLDDFVILKSSFGQSPLVDGRADFDLDGDVDLDDFVILKTNFGMAATAAAADVDDSANMLAVGATGVQSSPVPSDTTAPPIWQDSHGRVRPHRWGMRSRVGRRPPIWTGESFDALAASRLMAPLT